MKRRPGLEWAKRMMAAPEGSAYKVGIPSFQGDWGFYMSVAPNFTAQLPEGLKVMDEEAMEVAFKWPKYWFLENL